MRVPCSGGEGTYIKLQCKEKNTKSNFSHCCFSQRKITPTHNTHNESPLATRSSVCSFRLPFQSPDPEQTMIKELPVGPEQPRNFWLDFLWHLWLRWFHKGLFLKTPRKLSPKRQNQKPELPILTAKEPTFKALF